MMQYQNTDNTILVHYKDLLCNAVSGDPMLTIVDSRLQTVAYDLPALDDKSSRAAACLKGWGCEKGDRVLISARGTISIWSFFWGALKLGAIPSVLFPGLGAGGLEVRLRAAEACFFVTDTDPVKLSENVTFPKTLKKIILLGSSSASSLFDNYSEEDTAPLNKYAELRPEDDAFIVFTSGTTGIPKPVVHRHGIADAIVRSMKNILHAVPDDLYWCTAHPAWITGTIYGILGPLLCGIPSLQYDGSFHAKRWIPILQDQKVSLWYTAPTALRGLMREEQSFFEGFDFSSLRQIYSIGEPLSEKVYGWGMQTFHQPIYDTWFQTECGTIRIANQPGQPLRPGWMGRPVDDTVINLKENNRLFLRSGFASMFTGYYGMPEATAQKTADGYYDTGDLAEIDESGLLRFAGRADDVINTSGHLVGPLEVEQVLCAHPAVAAAAVVAVSDNLLYEAPAAFLVLKEGQEWNHQLETSLKVAVNNGVSSYAVPKHFTIIHELPLTGSGKINRSALRTEYKMEM